MVMSEFVLVVVAKSFAIPLGILHLLSPATVESADALARLRSSSATRLFE